MTAITLALSVSSSVKALTSAENAAGKFADSVRTGCTVHGLIPFAGALLDTLRGDGVYMGEKALRSAGTGSGSMFSKYTHAVRVLKTMAEDGYTLSISSKEGKATVVETVEKKDKDNTGGTGGTGGTGDGGTGESREQDGQTGAAIIASRSESLARLLAESGDAAILEAFTLMVTAGHKSAVARTIAAAIVFGHANKTIGEDIKRAMPDMIELIKLAS